MNKFFLILMVLSCIGLSENTAKAQQYRIITSIESVVPGGAGRSRIIDSNETVGDLSLHTFNRSEGGKSSKVKALKTENFDETKLLNFFSIVGINFANIASNDLVLAAKLNAVTKEGWTLYFVSNGSFSQQSKGDTKGGIFLTRYIFFKEQ